MGRIGKIQGQAYIINEIVRFCHWRKCFQQETLGNQREELVESLKTNKELEDYADSFTWLKSPLRSIIPDFMDKEDSDKAFGENSAVFFYDGE
jgi:hypothetical protein